MINEFVFDHTGTDFDAFIEVFGSSNTDYSDFWVLEIDGDLSNAGDVDAAIQLGTTDANGYFLDAENGTVSLLLVQNFTGSVGDDLDTDNDGTLDSMPWTAVLDSVAVIDADSTDVTYGAVMLTSALSGGTSTVGGASRIPNAIDTDTVADWVRNDFDGAGLPTLNPGIHQANEAINTPGKANAVTGLSINDSSALEGDTGANSGYNFLVTRTGDLTGTSTVKYRAVDGLAIEGANDDYFVGTGTLTFNPGEIQKPIPVASIGDFDPELDETFTVQLFDPTGAIFLKSEGLGVVQNDDGLFISKIHDIQGNPSSQKAGGVNDDVSSLDGIVVTVEAIVVGDFQNGDADTGRTLNGFYLQEEDADVDGDATTSEGIFVFDGATPSVDVNVGDIVQVTGTVQEFFGETQIANVTSVNVLSTGNPLPAASAITLPAASTSKDADNDSQPDLEAFEGMLVNFVNTLTISDMFRLNQFAEISLIEGGRTPLFTQTNDPDVGGYATFLEDIGRRSITYDDGLNAQNVNPGNLDGFGPVYNTQTDIRMGDTITNLSGVLDYKAGSSNQSTATWRVRSTEDGENTFTKVNTRDATPDAVGGTLQVGMASSGNFFTTIDGTGLTGPNQDQTPRGADSQVEFARQLQKLVTTLDAMDVDILGLTDIENDAGGSTSLQAVVDALNAVSSRTYAFVNVGVYGTEASKDAFLYDVATVTPTGNFAILDSTVDARFDSTENRPALAQTFTENSTGEKFTAAITQFKSKGRVITGQEDILDGQGPNNQARVDAAEALVDWLATDPTSSGDSDFLILGDLSAQLKEDPIKALQEGANDTTGDADDFTNIPTAFDPASYNHVFDGLIGTDEYALANGALVQQVTGTTTWHINADEATALDYNLDFGRDPDIFDGSVPFRTSSSDPIIVGLNLRPSLVVTTTEDVIDPLDGELSLRAAIALANDASAGADSDGDADNDGNALDTITFASGAGEAFENGGTIHLSGALGTFEVTTAVKIDGSTAGGEVIISGDTAKNDKLVSGTDITDVSASQTAAVLGDNVTVMEFDFGSLGSILDQITITGGSGQDGGGAFVSSSDVTIVDSKFLGNTSSLVGAGLYVTGGKIKITGTTFDGNGSGIEFGGGATFLSAEAIVEDSSFTNNTALNGGGLFSQGSTTTISRTVFDGNQAANVGGLGSVLDVSFTLTDSTVSNNNAAGGAGGILTRSVASTPVKILNSTISSNTAAGDAGGGIYNFQGELEVSNSTVTQNTADTFGGGIVSNGDPAQSASTKLTSTIVADNTATGSGADVGAADATNDTNTFISGGNNLIGTGQFTGASGLQNFFTNGVMNDIVGTDAALVDPLLGPLQDNGGPTETMLPGAGSPAIDAGANPESLTNDQRGTGFSREENAIADIGAVEAVEERRLVVDTTNDVVDETDGKTSLREAIIFANDATANGNTGDADGDGKDNDTITFAAGAGQAFENGATITLASALPDLTTAITIEGADKVTVDGAGSHRPFDVSSGADAILRGLTITGGRSNDGAGIRVSGAATSALLDGTTITGNNSSAVGGGVSLSFGASLTVLNSTISDNTATQGAGINAFDAALLSVINSTISGNTSSLANGGGIIAFGNSFGDVELINATIEGNSAVIAGGVLLDGTFNSALIHSSTITGNTAGRTGGVLLQAATSTLDIKNSIVLGNEDRDVELVLGTINETASITSGNVADIFAQLVTVDPDGTPNNADDFQAGKLADNGGPVQTVALKLDPTNPALDTGTAALPPDTQDVDGDDDTSEALPTDARGFVRDVDLPGVGGTPDAGAFEVQELPSLLVTTTLDVVDANDGVTSLREAILFANDATAGTAGTGDADNDGEANDTITFADGAGQAFENGGTITLGADLPDLISAVTIDGAGNVTVDGDDQFMPFTVTGSGDAILRGLTITRGFGDVGGAIAVTGGSAAALVDRSVVTESVVADQEGSVANGIAVADRAVLTVLDTTISGNRGDAGAGGIGADNAEALNVLNSTITDNGSVFGNGAGIQVRGDSTGDVQIINTTLVGNSNAGTGGGVDLSGTFDSALIHSSTITNNSSSEGSGISLDSLGTVQLQNSIVIGNSTNTDQIRVADGTVQEINSLTSGTPADVFALTGGGHGGGVLADNGGPVQTVALKASATNPAIDTGSTALPADTFDLNDNMDTSEGLPIDARGAARNSGTAPDMGAYEFNLPESVVINEFIIDSANDDLDFVELFGDPFGELADYTLLEVNGIDLGASLGEILSVTTFANLDADGYSATVPGALDFQDLTVTFLLVTGFTGAVGNDIDADDDGTIDTTPWGALIDTVAADTPAPLVADVTYAGDAVVDFQGLGFVESTGASRIPNGTDTDTAADWVANDTSAGTIGTQTDPAANGFAQNTPGAENAVNILDISISDVTINEGNASTTSANITVTLSEDVAGGFDLDYAPRSGAGDATDGVDFRNNTGSVSFAGTNGETQTVTINIVGDLDVELDETFVIDFVLQGFTDAVALNDDSATVTITNDDFPDFEVTTTDDEEAQTTDLVAEFLDGNGLSLREAIAIANAGDADGVDGLFDTITFASGSGEAFENGGLIRLTTGKELLVSSAVKIDGSTAGGDVIITGDADGDDDLLSGGNITDVLASVGNAKLGDNTRVLNFDGDSDGSILERVIITGGQAISGLNKAGEINSGGVKALNTDLTVIESTIAGNIASFSGGLQARFSKLTVIDSTISHNRSDQSGGGIAVQTTGVDPSTITNSTISNNFSGQGGGVLNIGGLLDIESSTISGNTGGVGGGVGSFGNVSTTTNVRSSIIAGNTATNGNDVASEATTNPVSSFVSLGNNLIGDGQFQTTTTLETFFTNGVNGDIVGTLAAPVDPRLGALQDNGGPTQTMAPDADSPAINAGSNSLGLTEDQRGTGFARELEGTADIGAVEREAGSLVVTTTADVVDAFDGVTSLREAVEFANKKAGLDTITFDAGVFGGGATIALNGSRLLINSSMQIDGDADGDGASHVTVDAGGQSRVAVVKGATTDAFFESLVLTGGGGVASEGGGLRIQNAAVTLIDTVISGNSTASAPDGMDNGGGVWFSSERTLTIVDSQITGNDAGGSGGGLFAQGGRVDIQNSTVTGNTAADDGGGLYALNSDLDIAIATIADNTATDGGGIALSGGNAAIGNTTIEGNTATDGNGGGIHAFDAQTILSNVTVEGNSAESVPADGKGGGISVDGGRTEAYHTTITGNSSVSGGGVFVDRSGIFAASNTLILGNSAGLGAEILVGSTGVFDDIGGNLVAGNLARVFDVIDGTTGGGALADNGGPVQTVALKARLVNPAIDQGIGPVPIDILDVDGNADDDEPLPIDARGFLRDVEIPGVGNTPDIGAYEIQIVPTPGPDILLGTSSADNLNPGGGNDLVRGFEGEDFFFLQDGGSDSARGGKDNDSFYFGAAFDQSDVVRGGAGDLDQIGLQGDYSAGVKFGPKATIDVEMIVLLPGDETAFGAPGTETYHYDLTLVNANIRPGETLIFQANTLRAGESFTLDASAELDGSVFTFGGLGTEDLTGGQQDDSFLFGEGRFGPNDKVDGQGGTLDSVGLQGDYSAGLTFGADQLIDIELLALLSNTDTRFGGAGSGTPYSYDLTMNDGNVAAGQSMIVNANQLASDEVLKFDGSAETDGSFQVYSGNGNDMIETSQNGDIISGRGGADMKTGNAGDDTFLYTNLSDSTQTQTDHITDLTIGDKIDLSPLDANANSAGDDDFIFIGSDAFNGTAGQLRAENTAANDWVVQADVDGDTIVDLEIIVTTSDGDAINALDFEL